MNYSEVVPSQLLQPFVECYRIMESHSQKQGFYSNDKVLPYGYTEIMFLYGDAPLVYHQLKRKQVMPRSLIFRQIVKKPYLVPSGLTGVFCINFKPAGLYQLLEIPLSDSPDKSIDFAEVAGAEANLVTEQIIQAGSAEKRIEITESFLLKKLSVRPVHQSYVHQAMDMLVESRGMISIKEMAAKLCISERQLERKFLHQVGIGPKLLARIIRANYVFKLFRTSSFLPWQKILQQCGYFDQAHFIKDFKSLSGEAPTQFYSRNFIMTDYFQGK